MQDNPDSIRPAGMCVGWAAAIVLAGAAGVALAEEPCEPGEGGYPPECPGIARIVVCDYGPLVDDDEGQCETFIAAIQRECEVTLAAIWLDQGNPNDNETSDPHCRFTFRRWRRNVETSGRRLRLV